MAVAKLGRYNERVVAMDVDTKNVTHSEIFKNEHPNRFIECYSAEQNMVGNYEVPSWCYFKQPKMASTSF